MRGHRDWKAVLGTLLAGALIVGCFVPVAYGVYKVYEGATTQTVTLLVNLPPDKVWPAVIDTASKAGNQVLKRDDKEMLVEVKRPDGIQGSARVITGPEKKGSAVVITIEKGKDPAQERQIIVSSALQVCASMNIKCSEQDKAKE